MGIDYRQHGIARIPAQSGRRADKLGVIRRMDGLRWNAGLASRSLRRRTVLFLLFAWCSCICCVLAVSSMNKATDAVTNNQALGIAVGVVILVALGAMAFYAWITKVSAKNRVDLEDIVRERIKDATKHLEERVAHLERCVINLENGDRAASGYMAQALNSDNLASCKGYIVKAMEAHA